ncbi:MAG: hypothetical protein JHC33_01050 [Ignisphaera sp.]|nr:hypothetical protein [Ignisphaera sp.]
MVKIDTAKWDIKTIFSGISLLISCVIMPIIFMITLRGDVKGLKKEVKDYKESNGKDLVNIQTELGELRRLHLSNKVAILENKQEINKNLNQIERNNKRLDIVAIAALPPDNPIVSEVKKKIPH